MNDKAIGKDNGMGEQKKEYNYTLKGCLSGAIAAGIVMAACHIVVISIGDLLAFMEKVADWLFSNWDTIMAYSIGAFVSLAIGALIEQIVCGDIKIGGHNDND